MADVNWSRISKEIVLYSRNVFKEQNIVVQDGTIEQCVDMFYNVITYRTQHAFLNGIDREMLPALQQCCCDDKGSLKDLRTIKTLVDAFLKRVLIISGRRTYAEVNEKCTKDLFVLSEVIPTYTRNEPRITAEVAESYKGRPDGLYLFAYTTYRRNEVHVSPDDDLSTIIYTLKHVLGFYIYMIYKLKDDLLKVHPEFSDLKFLHLKSDDGENMFYDFMNYGSATNALKNRIVNSFVFFQLYSKDMLYDDLIQEILLFSKQSLTPASAKRLLERLVNNGRILLNHSNVITLSQPERDRLSEVYSDYSERVDDINRHLTDIINNFSLTCSVAELFEVLKSFFENNFNVDLIEINDDITIDGDGIPYLYSKLESFGCSKHTTQPLIATLLSLCKDNDVLVRVGLGKLFTKISNPDVFESNVRASKKVFLDTTIVLYALCYNTEIGESSNLRYKSIKNLLSVTSGKKPIDLLFCEHYLSEVLYHLRQALLLIPFADRFSVTKRAISANVFYQYYFEMKSENKLPDNIDTFADFLDVYFNLEESDAYAADYRDVAESVVRDILYTDLGINVVNSKTYSEEKINRAAEVFKNTTPLSRIPKTGAILKNDSVMGLILFDSPIESPEPFFLTWDTAFGEFRKKYIAKYKRSNKLCWHLFSPQKFVNHIDLLEFKVNMDSLSDDLLSLIESDEYKGQTKYVIDRFSRFLDIPGIDSNKRRKYIKMLSEEIFNDQDFPNIIESEGDVEVEWGKAAYLLDKVLEHYKEGGIDSLRNYTEHVVDEDFFKSLLDLVVAHIDKDLNAELVEQMVQAVDSMMTSTNIS